LLRFIRARHKKGFNLRGVFPKKTPENKTQKIFRTDTNYELVTSQCVIDEASAGDLKLAVQRATSTPKAFKLGTRGGGQARKTRLALPWAMMFERFQR